MNNHLPLRTRRHLIRMAVAASASVPVLLSAAKAGMAAEAVDAARKPTPTPKPAACFLEGTLIRTPMGEREVESLRVGDLVTTLRGEQPIRWIGRNRFRKALGRARFGRAHPVRIARGAIDAATPSRDLYVSGDHALYLDGALIPAKLLENGTSIAFVDMPEAESVSYVHLEFDRHEVVFADGAPTESLLVYEPAVRERFSNFVEHERLYGPAKVESMVPFAPVLRYDGLLGEAQALARMAISKVVDVRDAIQVVYDRLAERARDPELV